ncbi:hypothetical protein, partial [Trichococcus flocculiformis]|uniref:hypothetical protein n=1 Tax=Trichococcus flocculiformis TaxID=82803 RepID=UPI0023F1DEA1
SNSICFRQYKKTNPKREKFSSGVCECGSLISTDKMSHQHHLTESQKKENAHPKAEGVRSF